MIERTKREARAVDDLRCAWRALHAADRGEALRWMADGAPGKRGGARAVEVPKGAEMALGSAADWIEGGSESCEECAGTGEVEWEEPQREANIVHTVNCPRGCDKPRLPCEECGGTGEVAVAESRQVASPGGVENRLRVESCPRGCEVVS